VDDGSVKGKEAFYCLSVQGPAIMGDSGKENVFLALRKGVTVRTAALSVPACPLPTQN
jgi:hypothetical protein